MDLFAFQKYFNEHDQFSVQNGIRLTHMQKGYAEAEMDVGPEKTNLLGTLHGGAYYTLADVAAGCSVIPYGRICVTLSADIHYLRPAVSGKITAYASVIQFGEKIGVCRVEIRDESQKILCISTITMYLTSKPIPQEFTGI